MLKEVVCIGTTAYWRIKVANEEIVIKNTSFLKGQKRVVGLRKEE
jgi:hypothetical protein